MARTSCLALVAVMACSGGSTDTSGTPPAATEQAAPAQPAPAQPGGAAPGASGAQGAGAAVTPAARAEAEQIFVSRCVACHGPQGKGDGPASAGLTPKPRNFQDPAWQDSVTDDHIEKIIKFGGAAVGKSPAMPANPDLTSKNEVVTALREHVRNLKQAGGSPSPSAP